VYLQGSNCPVCFNTVQQLLLDDPRVDAVDMSFSKHCLEVEHTGMANDDLLDILRHNLHGIELASNAEKEMVEVSPQIVDWHCHPPGA
jgi:hypothetical protein